MKVDFLIKGGEICTSQGRFKADIAVDEEKIVAIGNSAGLPEAEKILDVSGKVIIPGVIHTHNHWRDPGPTQKEDFTTGTICGAAGGITTGFAMPNVTPEPWDRKTFESWKKIAEPKCVIDYALYGAFGRETKAEVIPGLAEAGAIGIKVFNVMHVRAKYPYIPELSVTDHGQLYEVFETCAKVGIPITVHPDESDFVKYLVERDYISKGRTDPKAFKEARVRGIMYGYGMNSGAYDCALYSHITGAKLLILHIGYFMDEDYDLVRDAKAKGWDVHAEMECSPLFLTKEMSDRQGPFCNMSGTNNDKEAGWKAINDGTADIAVIEHAPHLKEEIEPGWKDMWNSALGLMGSQEFLPLMLTAVNEGKTSLENLVKLTSENVAKHFGIYPKKGAIQVGSDADLTIIDLEKEDVMTTEKVLSKCGWTSWDGYKFKGMPVYTIVRGTVVMENGKVVGKPGYGKFVPGLLAK